MESIKVKSWEELCDKVQEVQELRREMIVARGGYVSELLFRGHGRNEWNLQTTLERAAPNIKTLAQYFRLIWLAKPQIETLLTHRWDLPDCSQLEVWTRDYSNLKLPPFPGYDFLVYLRHHGFPSPLLDWSRSLSIAAYFAFAGEPKGPAAIYAYLENTGYGKATVSSRPQIISFGPYVRSHPRHFNQQSSYTMCCQFDQGPWRFVSHDLEQGVREHDQDRLWKITIPSTERKKVLSILDAGNVNAYALFQSEEALLQTIAMRELLLREKEI